MIKVNKDFDMTLNELLDADTEFVYLLDLFQINSRKKLIDIREELLEIYLFGGNSALDIKQRKNNISKYFILNTLPKHIRSFIQE